MLAAAALLLALAGAPMPHLHGVVLQTNSDNTAIVHHSAYSGMPAMTMTFRLPPGVVVHAADRIEADVDEHGSIWTLENVHVAHVSVYHAPPRPRPLAVGDPAPDDAFVDQHDHAFRFASLRGHAYALTFVYTRCRDARMCPLTSAKYRQLQAALPRGSELAEVTLDAAFDRPDVLAEYGKLYGADPAHWHILTGPPLAVGTFVERYGVDERTAGATILHTERLAVVGSDGRIARFFENASWSTDAVLAALKQAEK